MQAIFETLFDIVYLISVITLGIWMIRRSKGQEQYFLYGMMAVILGCGDAFHLVPRAVALCTTGLDNYTTALGIGKLVTSITMTLFYVLLYYVWHFFDLKSYCIMAVMMGGGIWLRSSGLVPDVFIAVFYTGLGCALALAGVLFWIMFFMNRTDE